jgi:NAD(P)-dependent dehydrogenase (short-subunit alcohol dehydrogenase family)
MGLLDGKAAIVTGSARGIGRATAELFVVEVVDQHLGALGDEQLGGRPPDPARRTRDDRGFPV